MRPGGAQGDDEDEEDDDEAVGQNGVILFHLFSGSKSGRTKSQEGGSAQAAGGGQQGQEGQGKEGLPHTRTQEEASRMHCLALNCSNLLRCCRSC